MIKTLCKTKLEYIKPYVPSEVYQYIKENKLYVNSGEIKEN